MSREETKGDAHCPHCGGAVAASATFCEHCGEQLDDARVGDASGDASDAGAGDPEAVAGEGGSGAPLAETVPREADIGQDDSPTAANWKMAVTGVAMGLLIGVVGAFAFSGLWTPVVLVVFVLGLVVGGYVTYSKRLPSEGIGTGLYVTALLLVSFPILYYIPRMLAIGGQGTQTASDTGAMIGSILGLVIWGFVFLMIGIIVAGVGYLARRRASKKLGTA